MAKDNCFVVRFVCIPWIDSDPGYYWPLQSFIHQGWSTACQMTAVKSWRDTQLNLIPCHLVGIYQSHPEKQASLLKPRKPIAATNSNRKTETKKRLHFLNCTHMISYIWSTWRYHKETHFTDLQAVNLIKTCTVYNVSQNHTCNLYHCYEIWHLYLIVKLLSHTILKLFCTDFDWRERCYEEKIFNDWPWSVLRTHGFIDNASVLNLICCSFLPQNPHTLCSEYGFWNSHVRNKMNSLPKATTS